MDVCCSGHEEVCFDSCYNCPVCVLISDYGMDPCEVEELEKELDDTRSENDDLQLIISEMAIQIENLEEKDADD